MSDIRDLSIDLGAFHLRHIDLSIQEGEYMVLLGPTGAGKTVLLECIVGLHRRHQGRIEMHGSDVSRHFPEERNVGYVPQDYALFPNLTVWENLAYGLRARRVPKAAMAEKVQALLARLGLTPLAGRFPLNLSGGEKQRIALGRALATDPHVLLLDEPLCALDETMRGDLAAELHRIQRSVRGTFLHVCHSLEEALDVADRIALMKDGALVQVGSKDDLLYRPASLFVARFTRARNFLQGNAEAGPHGSLVRIHGGPILRSSVSVDGQVDVSLRPETIKLAVRDSSSVNANLIEGTIVRCTPKLSHREVEVDAGVRLVAHVGHGEDVGSLAEGATTRLALPWDAVRLFSAHETVAPEKQS
jgi:ABC-type Fe3+/spermidine/putrescine transport system ATPase subunit